MNKSNSQQQQIQPLTCHGHTRPVVDLQFSDPIADGPLLISSCKGNVTDWLSTWDISISFSSFFCIRWQSHVTRWYHRWLDRHFPRPQRCGVELPIDPPRPPCSDGLCRLYSKGMERLLRSHLAHIPTWPYCASRGCQWWRYSYCDGRQGSEATIVWSLSTWRTSFGSGRAYRHDSICGMGRPTTSVTDSWWRRLDSHLGSSYHASYRYNHLRCPDLWHDFGSGSILFDVDLG